MAPCDDERVIGAFCDDELARLCASSTATWSSGATVSGGVALFDGSPIYVVHSSAPFPTCQTADKSTHHPTRTGGLLTAFHTFSKNYRLGRLPTRSRIKIHPISSASTTAVSMRTLACSARCAQAIAVPGNRFQKPAARKDRFVGSRPPSGPSRARHAGVKSNDVYTARAAFETTFAEDTLSLGELKSLLEDTLWGTQRGLSANSDTRAEILDLIAQMEAKTPVSEPNQGAGLSQLGGTWRLVYTSNSELVPILALGRLPLVEVGDITQTIDAASGKVENVVSLSVPFSKTSVGSTANFDVRSPKLLEIEFTDGRISTPQLMSDFELPDSVEVAGQTVDLTVLKSALQPLDGPVRSLIEQAATFLAGQQDFTFKTSSLNTDGKKKSTWLLNTYLDDDLRIARGDGGSLFVMKKSPLLELPSKLDMTIDEVKDVSDVDKVGPSAVQPVDVADVTEVADVADVEPFFPSDAKTELEEICEDDPSADECRVYED